MSFGGRGLSMILPTVYFPQVNFSVCIFWASFKALILCVCSMVIKERGETQKADCTHRRVLGVFRGTAVTESFFP